MNILHILSQHPESTGSGFYLQNMISQAAAAGHCNALVAGVTAGRLPNLDPLGLAASRYVSFDGGDLDFTIPGMSDVMPYDSSRFSELSADQVAAYEEAFAATITRAAADFAPDIIHSHHLWLVTAVARRVLATTPLVTSCHSTDLRQFILCPHLRDRVLTACRGVDRVLALSRDQAVRVRSLYGIKSCRIDIIGGGFDDALFTWSGQKPPPPVHLLYAGKLSYAKGVDWLLRTCLGLQDPNLHLHLAGSGAGEEGEHCLALAKHSGSGVSVHGRLGQRQLAALMRRCHIFILPSFYEGLPLVLLEALACGCRIVTTDLPGCRELLATAGSELVEMVRLPPMREVDQPNPENLNLLDYRLGMAISRMAARVRSSSEPDREAIRDITASSGWQAVFQRVQASYQQAVDNF